MKRIRIGKDIEIKWSVTTNGERRPLLGRDLRLVMHHTYLGDMPLPFNISESDAEMIVAHFRGVEHRSTGKYRLTLWENFGKDGQTAVDCCDAFELVATTCEETDHAPGDLDISTVNLGTANLQTGMPGKDGLSAYELFKKYNPDSKLTEEEYAEMPVRAAGVALAMVEQLEGTEAAVKQAEQGREAAERIRATAEQARVTEEQQRTLAEQTRKTNESARQTAEAGRQAAETKREENTSEAIRNSEEATRKAEDEAARVRALANNPPKIVEVDGMAYWAFYDLETQQYVTSEFRADDGTIVQQVEGADVSLDVKGGTMYVCSELTSLNIASAENSTKPSIIRFTSGATATQFSYPENFNITGWTKPEENKSYTICVLFGAGNMTYDE
mgnify:FL=1